MNGNGFTLLVLATLALVPASLWAAFARLAGGSWLITGVVFAAAWFVVWLALCAVRGGRYEREL